MQLNDLAYQEVCLDVHVLYLNVHLVGEYTIEATDIVGINFLGLGPYIITYCKSLISCLKVRAKREP